MLNLVLTIMALGVIAVACCNEKDGADNQEREDTAGQVYTSQYYDQSEKATNPK